MDSRTDSDGAAFMSDALAGTRFSRVEWVAETGSTNDDLAERANKGEREQLLVTDLQTAGRGRRGRVWDAPTRSGILMSLLIRDRTPANAFWSVAAIATAASEAIGELINVPCSVKWPNDVLIGDPGREKKVAGILSTMVDDAVIVGIGINVNWPSAPPAEVAETGTAVNHHLRAGDTHVVRPPLAADIVLRAIGHLESHPDVLRKAWEQRCSTLNRQVRIELEAGAIEGRALGTTPDGALVIDVDGVQRTYHVGDVVHLRPVTPSQ